MVKQVTVLHQQADIVAVADYSGDPEVPVRRQRVAGLGRLVRGIRAQRDHVRLHAEEQGRAGEITADELVRRPGASGCRDRPFQSRHRSIGLSDAADAEPRGDALPPAGLADAILKNAPEANIRDTETDLISALQMGQIDYLAIYRSDALQHHFQYLKLPAAIDLSDPKYSADYAKSVVHTKNGALSAKPIVYALTIPLNAPHRDAAIEFVKFILGPEGRKISAGNGFKTLAPAYVVHGDRMPSQLLMLTQPWKDQ